MLIISVLSVVKKKRVLYDASVLKIKIVYTHLFQDVENQIKIIDYLEKFIGEYTIENPDFNHIFDFDAVNILLTHQLQDK